MAPLSAEVLRKALEAAEQLLVANRGYTDSFMVNPTEVVAQTPHGSYTFAVTSVDVESSRLVLRLEEVERAVREGGEPTAAELAAKKAIAELAALTGGEAESPIGDTEYDHKAADDALLGYLRVAAPEIAAAYDAVVAHQHGGRFWYA